MSDVQSSHLKGQGHDIRTAINGGKSFADPCGSGSETLTDNQRIRAFQVYRRIHNRFIISHRRQAVPGRVVMGRGVPEWDSYSPVQQKLWILHLVDLLGVHLQDGVAFELHGGGELPRGQAEVSRGDHELVNLSSCIATLTRLSRRWYLQFLPITFNTDIIWT